MYSLGIPDYNSFFNAAACNIYVISSINRITKVTKNSKIPFCVDFTTTLLIYSDFFV